LKTIKISELNEHGVLAWDLIDILSICGEAYKDRIWIAHGVDCTETPWYVQLTQAPNSQLKMTYEEVLDYAKNIIQTYEGMFFTLPLGMQYDGMKIEFDDIKKISDFIIDFVDAGFIEVTADNEECIERMKSKLSIKG
jgi:hypothetical protein